MPVQETTDGVAELEDAALPVGGIVVNMTRPPLLPDVADLAALTPSRVSATLTQAGITPNAPLIQALLADGEDHVARVELERVERARIAALGRPVYELPALSGGIDLAALYELSDMLTEQGMA